MREDLWDLMAARRHVGLRRLLAPGPDDAGLQRILEAAAQAPDHGLIRPWRFVLIPAGRRGELGEVFVQAQLMRLPHAGAAARTAAFEKAFHAPCLLVAIVHDDPAVAAVPTAEKLVSLGCAVQNMLLAARALGFDSGLASGGALETPAMRRLLRLAGHERAICFIGFGSADPGNMKTPRERPQPGQFFSIL